MKKFLAFLRILTLCIVAGTAFGFAFDQVGIDIGPLPFTLFFLACNLMVKSVFGFTLMFKYVPFLAHWYLRFHPTKRLVMVNFGVAAIEDDEIENPGGLQVVGYWCPIKDIEVFPTLVPFASIANNDEACILQGNYTLASGKYWIPVYNTMDTSEVMSEAVGELDGKSHKYTYEGFIPNIYPKVLGFIRRLISTKGVFIRITVDGERVVVGTKEFPGNFITGKTTTGKGTADRRGTTYSIESRGIPPLMLYHGTLALSNTETLPAIS